MASLRSAALVRSLVVRTTGLSPADGGQNFETAITYVRTNLKHHRFLDADAEGGRVRSMYEELFEKLERHAEHSKAEALRVLCGTLCAPGVSSAAWEWSPDHPGVERGIAVLAALYWLSNASQMVCSSRAGCSQPSAGHRTPPSLRRMGVAVARESEEAARRRAEWQGVGAEAPVPAHWGYSDAELDEDDDAETGQLDVPLSAARWPAAADEEEDEGRLDGTIDGTGVRRPVGTSVPPAAQATPSSTPPRHSPRASTRAASLGLPPPTMHLSLIDAHGQGASRSVVTPKASGLEALARSLAPTKAPSQAVEIGARLSELRLLREAVRGAAPSGIQPPPRPISTGADAPSYTSHNPLPPRASLAA